MSVETASLESMCELIVDCPHSTPKWTDSGKIVLRNQNIRNGQLDLSSPSYTDEAGYKSRVKRAVPQAGDIVFTREAPMGEVCMIPSRLQCCLGQRQVLLRPKASVSGKYLYWALQSPMVQHQISWSEGTGTTVSNVRIPVLKSLMIPRRGVDEQVIATTLSSLADKIELNHQINQTLEQIAQAIFKSWFVDFDPVKAKIAAKERWLAMQPMAESASPVCYAEEAEALPDLETYMNLAAMQAISGKDEEALACLQTLQPEQYAELWETAELFPSAMQDSELGEIPEGWTIGPFSKIARLDTTSVKPGEQPDREWEHYSIPAFDERGSPAYELGQEIKSGKYKVQPTAVLSSKLNPHFPRTWIPDVQDPEVAVCSTEFMQFVPAEQQHRPFVAGMVTSEPFQKGIMMRVTGSTGSRQRAQPKQVAAMDVVLPTGELVTAYSLRTKAMYDMQARHIRQTRSLVSLRDALLPKLLSGELSVFHTESQVADVAEAENV